MMSVRDLIPWGRSGETPGPRIQDPFLALHREVNRLFDDFWNDFSLPRFGSGRAAWPRLEISESEKEIIVAAELPGMDQNEVELVITDNLLTMKGEKRTSTGNGEGVHLSERFYGTFERTIPLNAEIERDKVTASLKSGVLTVTLPKPPPSPQKTMRIPISGG
jgi:HSP20 family protein